MGAHSQIAERPEVSAPRRKEDEFVKKIRKLRWIGMNEEALRMEFKLSEFVSAEVVRSGPIETD
jgi:hypothetical protein